MPTHEQQHSVAGGLNLDDSLIAPAPGQKESLFQLGDYRYALNGRIGSSSKGDIGAFENIVGTRKISTVYYPAAGYSIEKITSSSPYDTLVIPDSYGDVSAEYSGTPNVPITDLLDASGAIIFNGGNYTIQAANYIGGIGTLLQVGTTTVGLSNEPVTGQIQGNGDQASFYPGGSMPAGTNKCVGFYENKAEQNGIFLNWNSNNDHGVYRFELNEEIIYEVLVDEILNFQQDKIITQIAMFDTILFFTDGINPQRLFDIDEIYKTKVVIEGASKTISDFHINLIKSPPVKGPRLEISTTGATDYLEFKVYQACFRYVYKDNTRSVWSPRSNIQTKGRQVTGSHNMLIIKEFGKIFGVSSAEETANSGLNAFKHDDIRAQQFIDHIEVAVKDSQYSPWRIVETEVFSTMGEIIANYYGDVKGAVVAASEIEQLQDYVPLLSGAGTGIDNKIMLGDNTEDFPHYDLVITDPAIYSSGSGEAIISDAYDANEWASITRSDFPVSSDYDDIAFLNNGNTLSFKNGGIYQLAIEFGDDSGRKSLAYAPEELRFTIPYGELSGGNSHPAISFFNALGFKIDSTTTPPEWATWYQILRSECLNIELFAKGSFNGMELRRSNTSGDVGKTVTEMADLSSHAAYEDIKDLLFSEVTTTVADASYIYIDIRNWSNPSTKVGSAARSTDREIVDIIVSATANPTLTENPSNKMYYNFKEGDVVRFPAIADGDILYSVFEAPIVKIEGTFIVVDIPDNLLSIPPATGLNALGIEIYRPKAIPDDSVPLYECGEWYPILFPKSASRAWSKTDWTYTDNASIVADDYDGNFFYSKYPVRNGDVHVVRKVHFFDHYTTIDQTVANNQVEVMNPDPDNAVGEWEHASGRPNVAYQNEARQRRKETQIKFGGNFIVDSIRNNLNNFEEANQKIYPIDYGRIMSLVPTSSAQVESVGTILLSINKNETLSIYVNRTTSEELSGNTQILLSDKVLGSYNTLLGSYGTLNPESVVVNDGRVYFYDVNDGVWVRYSRDGLTAISEYKVRNFHRDLSKTIRNYYNSSEVPIVLGGFDKYNEELITSFKHSLLPATFGEIPNSYKVLGFSDAPGQKRWKSFYDYEDAEIFGRVNTTFLGFKAGELYLHERATTGNTHSYFYGTIYLPKIQFVTNMFRSQNKIYQTINLISSVKCGVSFIGDIKGGGAQSQESDLILTSFDDLEGIFYSEILGDKHSFGYSTENLAMVNGDAMQGKSLRTLITFPQVNTHETLEFMGIGFSLSRKNPKN